MKKKEKNIICFDVLCQVFIFLVVFVRTGAGGQLGFRVEAFLLSLDWQSSFCMDKFSKLALVGARVTLFA